jgi:hypothetical protein
MQGQDKTSKRFEEIVNRRNETIKRTTIILDKEERDFIDQMVQDGKEAGIKPLISKMIDIYRSLMIYDWRFPGEYYCGISRIAFVNVELLNILVQEIPKENWESVGKIIGAALKVSMETALDLQSSIEKNWEEAFNRLRIQGFGEFFLKDKYILIKNPVIGYPELWKGVLEGLFEIKLEIKNTAPPLVFQIKKRDNPIH